MDVRPSISKQKASLALEKLVMRIRTCPPVKASIQQRPSSSLPIVSAQARSAFLALHLTQLMSHGRVR